MHSKHSAGQWLRISIYAFLLAGCGMIAGGIVGALASLFGLPIGVTTAIGVILGGSAGGWLGYALAVDG